ncbi:hypothetical protein ACIBG8_54115 [Nonomuraea sp. NPDC050556]|uniref:hypothetical protein n=1 Tax=Nonomuraea sp. NPDC050556 TaxID=3364369 RepID=UPI00378C5BF3
MTITDDVFTTWTGTKTRKVATTREGLRLAFYGRTSTADHQDKWSSRCWQQEAAESLIAGRGRIVEDFFDAGVSRSEEWMARAQAASLLAALVDPMRGFDAIVVGEYERAFAGDQL